MASTSTEIVQARGVITQLNSIPIKERRPIGDLISQASDVYQLYLEGIGNGMFVYNQLLITLEGNDGSGKSTQALMTASSLRDRGMDVIVLRGSGTTGTEDILVWTEENLPTTHPARKELVTDLKSIIDLQQAYTQAQGGDKMKVAAQMQIQMFQTINKYLELGLTVISDRGVLSALLGLRDRMPQGYEAVIQQVATAVGGHIPVGLNILVDAPLEVTLPRTLAKLPNGEDPDVIKRIRLEQLERRFVFLKLMELLDGEGKMNIEYINGDSDRASTQKQVMEKIWY